LRIEGRSSEISVEEQEAVLTFKVPLAPLATGIDLRDRHLRGYLEAEKFPVASLRVARAGLAVPKEGEAVEGSATGELTLHGQSRPVTVRYRSERTGPLASVQGSMDLDIRDFGIKVPSYLGVQVAPQVEVKVQLSVAGL
jgi:polyisoprenoid-binding protein YceI